MAHKIGHNRNKDPYPWEGSETLSRSTMWWCCDMELPATFYICPICEKERRIKDEEVAGHQREVLSEF